MVGSKCSEPGHGRACVVSERKIAKGQRLTEEQDDVTQNDDEENKVSRT